MFDTALRQRAPTVIDADALNLLAQAPRANSQWILTPHPGEAARLLGKTDCRSAARSSRRCARNRRALRRHRRAQGRGHAGRERRDAAVPSAISGNPGMASPGMGDVLTGVIAGIVAQTADLAGAARVGVLVHAMAGDMAARRGERGLLATDLLRLLADVRQSISALVNVAAPDEMRRRSGARSGARCCRRCRRARDRHRRRARRRQDHARREACSPALGVTAPIRSPTYTLIEPYDAAGLQLYHIDLYRLTDPREVEALGIRDLLDARAVLLIEWPSRGAGALPAEDLSVLDRISAVEHPADATRRMLTFAGAFIGRRQTAWSKSLQRPPNKGRYPP